MLEELMRRCREDSYDPTYQDLVALRAHPNTPADDRIALLEAALKLEHSRLVEAQQPIDVAKLRAAFERTHADAYNFRRGRRGGYTNPTTATKWIAFRKGAEYARAAR